MYFFSFLTSPLQNFSIKDSENTVLLAINMFVIRGEFYRYITEVFHENQLGHMDINGEFRRQFQTKQYCLACATEEEMAKEKYRNVINIRVSDEDINAQYVISLLDNFLYCCNKCKKAVITIEYK
nr:hypothetical protein [Microctonus hyperodae filamentous virus]